MPVRAGRGHLLVRLAKGLQLLLVIPAKAGIQKRGTCVLHRVRPATAHRDLLALTRSTFASGPGGHGVLRRAAVAIGLLRQHV